MKNKIIAFLSLVIISVGCKKSENNIPTQEIKLCPMQNEMYI